MSVIGIFVVIASVLTGYIAHEGNLLVLWQWTEFVIIGGAAFGSLLVSCSPALLKQIVSQVLGCLTSKGVSKENYTEVLMCLYEVTKTGKGNMLGLEAHVETPENSEIFKKYPQVIHNHHAISFMCDTLKIQISSPMSPYDLEELMDQDIQATHNEELRGPNTVSRIGDALPGLGIVAAVLGVVITMGHLADGKEVIGHSVAAALVGTFLGVLLSYGFVQPLAAKMESDITEHGKILDVIKACLLTFAKDASPKVCIEFARRTIPPESRPSFKEVDEATASVTTKKAA